jgi:hypothetical protein
VRGGVKQIVSHYGWIWNTQLLVPDSPILQCPHLVVSQEQLVHKKLIWNQYPSISGCTLVVSRISFIINTKFCSVVYERYLLNEENYSGYERMYNACPY